MEDDEDLFDVLDGMQQATRSYEAYKESHEQHQRSRRYAPGSSYAGHHQTSNMLTAQGHGTGNASASRFDLSQYAHYEPGQEIRSSSPLYTAASRPTYVVSHLKQESGKQRPDFTREPSRPHAFEPSTQHRGPQVPQSAAQPHSLNLLSTHTLPDRFRSVFPYPNFNAMQTKCFPTVYQSNDNFVLSSPTGSGKTVIFELAICRLINALQSGQYKVVYQAPTKSLCSERQRDWQQKFRMFQLDCAELTGDTDPAHMRNVQSASIIITTPEKWDSVTRKWKDHEKLMNMIKLFLIDEVHMLHEERGATLEAVVSRMKSVQSDVRFIALSATVPNSNDIAMWLGRDSSDQDRPAREERFGEEFRPVRLQKHVVGYFYSGNEFSFEKMLDSKLAEVIPKYSQGKPIMVFCFTRKSCEATARMLASWWSSKASKDRHWQAPKKPISVEDKTLNQCVPYAVACHHAGLSFRDRNAVEQGFLNGNINVICCTSTLAVGMNLPCHMVIIKNTVTYANGEGIKEYTDLEIMQMLGRAGRPQYDTSAAAVIMTRQEKVQRYERMVSGEQILESCLHEHLIDHLNAEIGLGTVTDLSSAKKWLCGTFLYVRLRQNPNHYRLDGTNAVSNIDALLEDICCRDIDILRTHGLVDGDNKLESTAYGEAMARYCVHFETAKVFLKLPDGAKLSEILSALAMASEWQDIRFRGNEKSNYKELNKSAQIRFPIPVNLDSSAHKVSLIVQSQLGAVNLPTDEKNHSNAYQYQSDTFLVFQHIRRLVRCIIDFKLAQGDSVSLRNALFMCRSLGARCWDDSPLQLKQLEKIGVAGVRKLVALGINSIEALELVESHRIETALQRNPPFGLQVLDAARAFPRLRISVNVAGKPIIKARQGAKVNINAEIGFLNDKPPHTFHNRQIATKVGKGQLVKFSVTLTSATQAIHCYVMCDEIAGTCTCATIKPTLPSVAWPNDACVTSVVTPTQGPKNVMNTSRRRGSTPRAAQAAKSPTTDDFGDDLLDEADLLAVLYGTGAAEYRHIDSLDAAETARNKEQVKDAPTPPSKGLKSQSQHQQREWQPTRLADGRWECNHKCKNKQACRHLCCKEGLDKPPKAPKSMSRSGSKGDTGDSAPKLKSELQKGQTKLDLRRPKKPVAALSMDADMELMDLTNDSNKPRQSLQKSRDLDRLAKLHSSTQSNVGPSVSRFIQQNRSPSTAGDNSAHLTFLPPNIQERKRQPTEYGSDAPGFVSPSIWLQAQTRYDEDAALVAELTGDHTTHQTSTTYDYDESDSVLEQALVGAADSEAMRQRLLDIAAGKDVNDGSQSGPLVDHLDSPAALEPKSPNVTRPPSDALHTSRTIKMSPVRDAMPREATRTSEPFMESSSDALHFSYGSSRSQKRKRSSLDDDLDAVPSPVKKQHSLEIESLAETVVPKSVEKATQSADRSSSPPTEIDPTIMQMFGPYVDFV